MKSFDGDNTRVPASATLGMHLNCTPVPLAPHRANYLGDAVGGGLS